MTRPLRFLSLLVGAVILIAQGSRGDVPAKDYKSSQAAIPVGTWTVVFANGVTEVCRIGDGGKASVEEPRRRSPGMAVAKDDSVVVTFNDDRIERWTWVGKRLVVEHWFPGSRFPTATPVLGIAEPTP